MPPEPKDTKDVKVVVGLVKSIQQQICAAVDLLDSPFKETFLGIKAEFDSVVAKLPLTDAVPAALELSQQLQSLWSCLYSVNSLVTFLNGSLDSMKKNMNGQMNSAVTAELNRRIAAGELIAKENIAVKVQEQVTSMTTAGDLVPKATVTQLCADAKNVGLTEGEKKVRDEFEAKTKLDQKVTERKATLQTAGLPIPDAEIEKLLGGTDDEFAANKTRLETQLAEFKSKGITLAADSPIRSKAWLPADQFKNFLALTDGIPSLKSNGGGEPFANGGAAGTPASGSLPFPV